MINTKPVVIEIFEPPFRVCPVCGVYAICLLPPRLLAQQPDDTNVVCHPKHGGCNHGFELVGATSIDVHS